MPDPARRLDLPEGFSYTVVDQGGQTMSDGYRVPGNPDGMACFQGPRGTLVLLRNHELTTSSRGPYWSATLPREFAPEEAYDPDVVGGVTRLVVDAETHVRISSNLVLAGTAQNCSGGSSPWGFLTCEEIFDARHGYVFLCSADAERVARPQRIVGYGHFRHEAAAIDPAGNVAYLTEDRPDSAFYRFVPDDPNAPFVGRLQALAVTGRPRLATSKALSVGDELDVSWVDLPDPDPTSDSLRSTAQAGGAALVSRGEGVLFDRGVVYFTATDGGPMGLGQVFALRPTETGGTLTLVAQSEDSATLDGPDNLCRAPSGDVFICEDGFDAPENYIRGLTPNGELYDFARTTLSELSGLCFSPDGRALFLNIFGADVTLVVTGPFPGAPQDGSGGQGGQSDGAGEPVAPAGGDSSRGIDRSSVAPRSSSADEPGCGCEVPGRRPAAF